MVDFSLFENFIEPIAQLLSRALSDKEHKGKCFENCIIGLFRTFFITYCLKYSLGFFPSLVLGKIYKRPELIVKLGGRDTTSFAAFMAVYISSYKGILCFMRWARKVSDPFNAFVAGTISGFSLLLDKNHTRRVMIALYLSTRTLHFMGRWIWRHHISKFFNDHYLQRKSNANSTTTLSLPSRFSSLIKRQQSPISPDGISGPPNVIAIVSQELQVDEDDAHENHHETRKWLRQTIGTIVMALSSSQILYAYVCEPHTLAQSYLSFLLTHGGVRALQPKRAKQYLDVMGSTILSSSASKHPSLFVKGATNFKEMIPADLPVEKLLPFASFLTQVPHDYVMCAVQHPSTSSCLVGLSNAFLAEWNRAFGLYLPLNLLMGAVFRGKRILSNPVRSLRNIFLSVLRSTLFLSCYVTTAWSLPCLLRRSFGTDKTWMYYVNGIFSGLMVLIEQPGRRLELGMYCLPRAIESLWNSLVYQGKVYNIPRGEALYFGVFSGVMMTLYQNEPGSIHETYRGILHRLFGIN